MSERLSAFVRLTRFEHAILFALAVLIAEIIAAKGVPPVSIPIVFSLLIPVFSEMAAFALNDILDIKSDRLNKKEGRPLVGGELTRKFAFEVVLASLLLSMVLAYLVNMTIFWITLAVNILAILYNVRLKDLPLFGNLYVAFTMGIPLIFGNYVITSELNPANVIIAVLGFVVGLGREIVKSVEDMKGDRLARKSETLPLLIGAPKSLAIAAILYAVFIMLSVVPYYYFLKIGIGFALVFLADLAFLYSALVFVFSRRKNEKLPLVRKLSLVALFLGLVGILASVLGF